MKFVTKVKPFYTDERGSISHLLSNKAKKIKSVLLITCKKDSVRANHYHKRDIHYVYMLKGRMKYYHLDVKEKQSKKKSVIVNAGELIYTPAKVAHSMKFLEDSTFLALSTEPRNQGTYEKDTIKIKLI